MQIKGAPMAHTSGIISGGRQLSQTLLQHRVLQAASGLAELGVGPQDAVAMLLRNDFAVLETVFAANRLGAYAVPINWHFKAPEVAYILQDCAAKILVVHADLLAAVRDAIPAAVTVLVVATPPEIIEAYGLDESTSGRVTPPRSDTQPGGLKDWDAWLQAQLPSTAPAMPSGGSILYTSGTTGQPKGVRRAAPTASSLLANQQMTAAVYGLRAGMRVAVPGPLYHSAPYSYTIRAGPMADLIALMPRFDPIELLALIERERIEGLFMVPTMFVRLLKLPDAVRARYDVSSLRFVIHAAAPCPPDVKRAMLAWWGPVIWEFYGGTETGALTLCNASDWLAYPGTVGRATEGATLAIFDDAGQRLPVGGIGEVYGRIAGLSDFTYHGKPEERAKVERDGLITCGDVGYLNADGFLFLSDRKRDMVISGGVNIYPAEIEAVLHGFPEVADCAVFGVPDDDYGEALMAVIQPQPGMTIDTAALQLKLASQLANYKVPRRIEVRHDLPREDSGKIFKRVLRDPYWANRQLQI
jgi:long-chain acyl-CoA synthetase